MNTGIIEIPGELLARLTRYGRVHVREEVTSTNEYAFGLAAEHSESSTNPPIPALVIARRQTAGRGRFRRPWYSDDNSLTYSLLIYPDAEDPPLPTGQLTLITGLAVCLGIEDLTGTKPRIRWPNDVLLNDRKICGILCEQRKNALVVGVGLNVNQTEFPEDPELAEAGSIRQATDRKWERLELLEAILRRFSACLERVRQEELPALMEEFKSRSAILHRRVEAKTRFRRHYGTVVDIDGEGQLVIRRDNGSIITVNSGQVRRLR